MASLCLQCRHQDAHTLSRARLKQNKITTNIRSYTLPPYKDVSIQITPIHTILKINIGIRGSNQKWFHVVISRHRWTRNERRLEDIAIFPKGFGIFTKMLRTKNSACWETSKNTKVWFQSGEEVDRSADRYPRPNTKSSLCTLYLSTAFLVCQDPRPITYRTHMSYTWSRPTRSLGLDQNPERVIHSRGFCLSSSRTLAEDRLPVTTSTTH